MKIGKILVLALLFSVLVASGCTEDSSSEILMREDVVIKNDGYKTVIGEDFITGKIVNIISDKDIILFEDGTMVGIYYIDRFTWRLGEVYLIEYKKPRNSASIEKCNKEIKTIKILPENFGKEGGYRTDINRTIYENISRWRQHTDGNWPEQTIIVGNVTNFVFNPLSTDIIFEDGTIIVGYHYVKEFSWQVNRIHRLTCERKHIHLVEILEDKEL